MVTTLKAPSKNLHQIGVLLRVYLVVVIGTVGVLVVLSATAPPQAPADAWGHAIIVAILAGVLMLRYRAAQRGSAGALRAVGLIAAVLVLVNVVEALVPGFVPIWMKVEMVAIAALMALVIGLVVRERV